MQAPRNVKSAMIVTIMLLPIVYFTVYQVLTGQFSNDVKSLVVGAIVGALLTAISGFWLGGTDSEKHSEPPASPPQS
jgi:hypothetical protein